ncbi:hypothetical protein, partial [Niveispirillum fermenti]|uniref:hypothetical protein n=1 Tax=Niveispirillum fermenti TaxID=1233113 RepID=UPI003A8BC5FE
ILFCGDQNLLVLVTALNCRRQHSLARATPHERCCGSRRRTNLRCVLLIASWYEPASACTARYLHPVAFDHLDQLSDPLDARCAALSQNPQILAANTKFNRWPAE